MCDILVVGSINADIYLHVERLPHTGETISALPKSGAMKAGGKGANTAVAAGRALINQSTNQSTNKSTNQSITCAMCGYVGNDSYAQPLIDTIKKSNVDTQSINQADCPTGSAYIIHQSSGDNSIIIVGGANELGWDQSINQSINQSIQKSKLVMLQREIPDSINQQVIEKAREFNIPVILDLGGRADPPPRDWYKSLFCIAPNETELARIANMDECETDEQVEEAANKLISWGVQYVLVTLGSKGAKVFSQSLSSPVHHPAFKTKIVDTTGAGDTFRGAFAAALVESFSGQSQNQSGKVTLTSEVLNSALRFASAAAGLACTKMGAIESIPERSAINDRLKQEKSNL